MKSRRTWIAPAGVAVGMATFALFLHFGLCAACSQALAPWVVAAAGVLWAGVFWLSSGGHSRLAYTVGLFAIAAHGGLVISAPSEACTSCWSFLAGEGATVVALGLASGLWALSRWKIATATVLAGMLAFGGSATVAEMSWRGRGPIWLGGSRESDLKILVFVKSTCPACRTAIEDSNRAIAEGIGDLVGFELLEVMSPQGREAQAKYDVHGFPAFAAVQGDQKVHSQVRGSIEEFLRALGIVKEGGRWIRRPAAQGP